MMIKKIFRYGIDAPLFSIGYVFLGIVIITLSLLGVLPEWMIGGIICLFFGMWMIFSSIYGKSIVLDRIINKYVPKNEKIKALDIGTGRGLVLGKVARIKNVENATGIDLWLNKDQSNNDLENTTKNMEYEGVSNKIFLDTGNMMNMPYDDGSFNFIIASFSIHNVGRNNIEKVCQEIYRVAKNNSIIIIFDIKYISKYKSYFEDKKCQVIEESLPTVLTFPLARTLVVKK